MLYENLNSWTNSIVKNLWLPSAILCFVLFLEFFFQGKDNSLKTLWRSKGKSFDFFALVMSSLRIHHILIDLLLLGFLVKIKNWANINSLNYYIEDSFLGSMTTGALFLVTYDFLLYWNHRLKHKFEGLWISHRFHHSTTDLNAFSYIRDHALDKPWRAVSVTIPILLIAGPTFLNLFWLYFLDLLIGIIAHSRLDTGFGIWGKIFVSPRFHRRHHSLEDHNCNFGLIFSYLDRFFGTYKDDSKAFSCQTGTIQMDDTQNVFIAYIKIYINFANWCISKFFKKNRQS